MAVAGRNVLRWLAQPHVLDAKRAPFETKLLQIAESSEEWLTSAQSLGLARRAAAARRALPLDRGGPAAPTGPASRLRAVAGDGVRG
jgi:hypothetical protein